MRVNTSTGRIADTGATSWYNLTTVHTKPLRTLRTGGRRRHTGVDKLAERDTRRH